MRCFTIFIGHLNLIRFLCSMQVARFSRLQDYGDCFQLGSSQSEASGTEAICWPTINAVVRPAGQGICRWSRLEAIQPVNALPGHMFCVQFTAARCAISGALERRLLFLYSFYTYCTVHSSSGISLSDMSSFDEPAVRSEQTDLAGLEDKSAVGDGEGYFSVMLVKKRRSSGIWFLLLLCGEMPSLTASRSRNCAKDPCFFPVGYMAGWRFRQISGPAPSHFFPECYGHTANP